MRRIALIHPRYGREVAGSAAYYARMIAEHLANRYEVEVFTTQAVDADTWTNWYARNTETVNGVYVRRFPVEELRTEEGDALEKEYADDLSAGKPDPKKERQLYEKKGPFSPECIQYISQHQRDFDDFIFVSYDNYLTVMGLPIVAKRAILIPTAHESDSLYFLTVESLFQNPRKFVFLSNEERLLIRRRFPKTDPIPCAVIGTGVYVPDFIDTQSFLQSHRIDSPYLCYVGRIDTEKACDTLIQYFLEYKARCGGDLKLLLIGKIEMKIPEHPDICALGFVPDREKYAAIAAAKALVVPSKYETISLSLLEAMSLSIPVLVNADCSVLRGHCQRSNAGLYYRGYFEFEGAVNYLFHHPTAYMQLCANAKKYISDNYSWELILQKFDELIRE